MRKSLVFGVIVLLVSVAIVSVHAAGMNPLEDLYTQIIQKMDEIKTAIQNQELDPNVTVDNTINMPTQEPQMAHSVEEILLQLEAHDDEFTWGGFAFPNGKEWSTINVTELTFIGYIRDPYDVSIDDGGIEINNQWVTIGRFDGHKHIDPDGIDIGTNIVMLWADTSCDVYLEKIIIEYDILPAN